ncbi:hypothetical protein [Alteromonas sp. 14N.309.X.WAT.G.H12]|uniref:hypothetical protein n=1 Tax=Alteromonas sp. 14N.309.X.WAT.G.H12 TaxID=3120824 RepID=UPI002FD195B9
MKTLFRYLLIFALFVAAMSSYSYGNQMGMFLFVVLGLFLETAFWFNLFPRKKQ